MNTLCNIEVTRRLRERSFRTVQRSKKLARASFKLYNENDNEGIVRPSSFLLACGLAFFSHPTLAQSSDSTSSTGSTLNPSAPGVPITHHDKAYPKPVMAYHALATVSFGSTQTAASIIFRRLCS